MKKCKICNSNTIQYQHPQFNFLFHECLNCSFIFKDDLNYISKEEELHIYNQHQNTLDNEGYVNYLTNFVESAVIPYIQRGKALDFGSGPNPVLAHILNKEFGFEVSIFDYYYAKHNDYTKQTYDLITSTEVVEHIRDPLQTFKQLKILLNDEGILSIMTLFHPNDRDEFFKWFYIRDLSHVSFFAPKTMQTIANLTGLKLIFCNHYRTTVFKK